MAAAKDPPLPRRRPRLHRDVAPASVKAVVHALALRLFVSTRAWHHFVTITVDRGAEPDQLTRLSYDSVLRRLAFAARQRITHCYAVARDRITGWFAHGHALLHGTAAPNVRDMRRLWPFSFTDLSRHDDRQRFAHYVVKDLLIAPATYNFSKRLPPAIRPWTGDVGQQFKAVVAVMTAAQP